jgi:hypothetical protein
VLKAILGVMTSSHHLSMEPCHRLSKEGLRTAGEGSGTPRGQPPLTVASLHHLHVAGHGLDMDHYSMGFCPS